MSSDVDEAEDDSEGEENYDSFVGFVLELPPFFFFFLGLCAAKLSKDWLTCFLFSSSLLSHMSH